jgi:hypothetical protein
MNNEEPIYPNEEHIEPLVQSFPGNPHALIKDGVCTEVVYMQENSPEEIEALLSTHDYDKVVCWDDYGHEIYIDFVEYENDEGIYYASRQPYPSWTWHVMGQVWKPPVMHPIEVEIRDNVILNTEYEWDEKSFDWVVVDMTVTDATDEELL